MIRLGGASAEPLANYTNVVRADSVLCAMERASILVEDHPGQLGKTRLALMVGGRKQAALKAIDRLCSEGFVGTARGGRGKVVYTPLRPYRQDPGLPVQFWEPVVREPLGTGNLKDGIGEPVPSGNDREPCGTDASGQTAAAGLDNDREAPHTTANGSEPALVTEPRWQGLPPT